MEIKRIAAAPHVEAPEGHRAMEVAGLGVTYVPAGYVGIGAANMGTVYCLPESIFEAAEISERLAATHEYFSGLGYSDEFILEDMMMNERFAGRLEEGSEGDYTEAHNALEDELGL